MQHPNHFVKAPCDGDVKARWQKDQMIEACVALGEALQ